MRLERIGAVSIHGVLHLVLGERKSTDSARSGSFVRVADRQMNTPQVLICPAPAKKAHALVHGRARISSAVEAGAQTIASSVRRKLEERRRWSGLAAVLNETHG